VRSYRTFSPLLAFAPFGRYGAAGSDLTRATAGACCAEASKGREGGRYVFCATVLQVALTGR
jgi:hypothetical protein